jgi:glycosyltransferase involved in cell wall biosynthesis
MRIDICVITYRRPQGLQRLLGGLQQLELPAPAADVRVVVVDNDPEESARELCQEAQSWLSLPLTYRVEKRRGIPQARNTALAAALEGADCVAFIDDDAEPDPRWLVELCRIRESRGADAVTGPCESLFEEPPPRWIARGDLFARPRHTTGQCIAYARTGNVLIATEALARMDHLFDERMALTGSSDTEFFRRFAACGNRIVWADGAVVHEWVQPSRATFAWLLKRSFRVGTSESFIDRALCRPPRSAARILAQGVWCVAKGAALALLGSVRGRAGAVPGLRLATVGLGRLAGLAGYRYEEYRTIHGG